MANKKTIQISFQDAYQVFKNQDLGQKRMIDRGESDKEIIEDILLHYGVELINPNDENLEEEKQVSFITIANFWYFHGLAHWCRRLHNQDLCDCRYKVRSDQDLKFEDTEPNFT